MCNLKFNVKVTKRSATLFDEPMMYYTALFACNKKSSPAIMFKVRTRYQPAAGM